MVNLWASASGGDTGTDGMSAFNGQSASLPGDSALIESNQSAIIIEVQKMPPPRAAFSIGCSNG
jgi:hypothetical protein